MSMYMCVLILNRKKWSVLRESIGLTWSVHRQRHRVYDQNHYFMAFISSHIHVFAFSSLVHFAFFFVSFNVESYVSLWYHVVVFSIILFLAGVRCLMNEKCRAIWKGSLKFGWKFFCIVKFSLVLAFQQLVNPHQKVVYAMKIKWDALKLYSHST